MTRNFTLGLVTVVVLCSPASPGDSSRTPFASMLTPRTDAPLVWVVDGAGRARTPDHANDVLHLQPAPRHP